MTDHHFVIIEFVLEQIAHLTRDGSQRDNLCCYSHFDLGLFHGKIGESFRRASLEKIDSSLERLQPVICLIEPRVGLLRLVANLSQNRKNVVSVHR